MWVKYVNGLLFSIAIFTGYVFLVEWVPSSQVSEGCQQTSETQVGICTAVSATVKRGYYLGLVTLQTKAYGFRIHWLNNAIGFISCLLGFGTVFFYRNVYYKS